LVPALVRGTANPAVRAKFPPLAIGRTKGTLVARLKAPRSKEEREWLDNKPVGGELL
jgi:hypothetical protein